MKVQTYGFSVPGGRVLYFCQTFWKYFCQPFLRRTIFLCKTFIRSDVERFCYGEVTVNIVFLNDFMDCGEISKFKVDDFCGCFRAMSVAVPKNVVPDLRT